MTIHIESWRARKTRSVCKELMSAPVCLFLGQWRNARIHYSIDNTCVFVTVRELFDWSAKVLNRVPTRTVWSYRGKVWVAQREREKQKMSAKLEYHWHYVAALEVRADEIFRARRIINQNMSNPTCLILMTDERSSNRPNRWYVNNILLKRHRIK